MNTEPTLENKNTIAVTDQQKNLVLLVYILQAAAFLVGITSIAGVIINYVKRDEVRGSWLESHFNWQIKTFWWALLGYVVGAILLIVAIGGLLILATSIWVVYRIVKGWLAYNDQKPLPDTFF